MSSTFALPRNPVVAQARLAPPREGHWFVPVLLALLAHGLLGVALTWGVGWKQDVQTPVFEAELWARVPVEAAPRAEQPPPPPAPQVRQEPPPQPRSEPPPPAPTAADIATRRAQQQAERDAEREKRLAEKLQAQKAAADKALADKKRLLAQQQAAEQKAADEQRERDEKAESQRQENIRRMLGQAGASGGPQARGTATQSAGPSAGYGARVIARIKPNVVFTDTISGNPRAEVEVRTLPDGTIVGRRIVKSSGNSDWDEAALKAIDRTGTLPRDTDGRVPPSLIIGLRPQD